MVSQFCDLHHWHHIGQFQTFDCRKKTEKIIFEFLKNNMVSFENNAYVEILNRLHICKISDIFVNIPTHATRSR